MKLLSSVYLWFKDFFKILSETIVESKQRQAELYLKNRKWD